MAVMDILLAKPKPKRMGGIHYFELGSYLLHYYRPIRLAIRSAVPYSALIHVYGRITSAVATVTGVLPVLEFIKKVEFFPAIRSMTRKRTGYCGPRPLVKRSMFSLALRHRSTEVELQVSENYESQQFP